MTLCGDHARSSRRAAPLAAIVVAACFLGMAFAGCGKSSKDGKKKSDPRVQKYIKLARALKDKACSCKDEKCYNEWRAMLGDFGKKTEADLEEVEKKANGKIGELVGGATKCINPLVEKLTMARVKANQKKRAKELAKERARLEKERLESLKKRTLKLGQKKKGYIRISHHVKVAERTPC